MKPESKKLLQSYFIITIGSLLYGLSYDWFFLPNELAMGGLTGIAQIIYTFIPVIPVGTLVFLMNIPLFYLGWKYIGGHLLLSSFYSMIISSFSIDLFNALYTFKPLDDPMLATLCGGVTMGIAFGMVFSQGATTGGTDVIARLLKLKFPWLPLGKLLLVPDFSVIVLSALTFGHIESALYGITALYIYTKVMDTVLYGMDTSKVAYIISDQYEAISKFIINDMDRGVTLIHATGGWSGEDKKVLMVAFKQREIVQIKQAVHDLDPRAFLIVCDAHDVLGEGFRAYHKDDI